MAEEADEDNVPTRRGPGRPRKLTGTADSSAKE
jgi:hypothetical protein